MTDLSTATSTHPFDVVRRVFPLASEDECNDLLWSNTGYPSFWRTGNPVRDILHSLRTLKRTLDAGHRPCEYCNRKATGPRCNRSACRRCNRILLRAARATD